jgi:hypothetical protein
MSELPADEFKRLITERTGIDPGELVCPREHSDMTPCIARDGDLAVAFKSSYQICIGCGRDVLELLEHERERIS